MSASGLAIFERVVTVDEIREALSAHRARTLPAAARAWAAVALVLCERNEEPELLFIERALREGDPWSGHMAFPGGRVESGDRSARQAAERETWEEVGIALDLEEPLGQLDDLEGRHAGHPNSIAISAFVYRIARTPSPLVSSDEVTEALWVPVSQLLDARRHTELTHRSGDRILRYPGIVVGRSERHVVWGLTYRFLEAFLEVVGRPLPARWQGFR